MDTAPQALVAPESALSRAATAVQADPVGAVRGAPSETRLDGVITRTRNVTTRLEQVTNVLSDRLAQLRGPVPPTEGLATEELPGTLGAIESSVDTQQALLSRIEGQITELFSLV